ncbi:MAG TPA: tetratricopeptide repeat protein [Draconibacterium sp.]|nr:tetratricopeptide repeat protein [Draconibacterium sp.]
MKYFLFIIVFFFLLSGVTGQENQKQNQIQTQSNLAFQYYNARDFEKAIPLLFNVYEISKNSTYFKYYLDCLIQIGKYDEAARQIQTEIKKQRPEKPEFYVHWGYVLKAQKNTGESKLKYEKAIEIVTANKNEYSILANAFLGWQEYDYARQTYLKGEKIFGAGQFDYELARAYSYLRDYNNMMEKYLDLLGQNEQQLPRVQSSLSSTMRLDIDDEMLDTFREQVLKRIQANPDVIGYNRLLIWFFLQENKFANALRQSIALDRRTGQEDAQIIQLGNMALNNKKYEDAKKAFEYLMGKGKENPFYAQSFVLKMHASYLQYIAELSGNKEEGEKVATMFKEGMDFLGINAATLNLVQDNAHLLAFYLDKTDDAIELLKKALEIPRLKTEEWGRLKTEMADIYIYANDPWEATLLYSQVIDGNKNNSLGDDVKLKKAKLGYYLGNFSWAKAQLDVLKASTSKLTANDAMELSLMIGNNLNLDTTAIPLQMFARADLLFFRNKDSMAMATLDSLAEIYPHHTLVDDILFRKAKIEINRQNYALAAGYFEKIVSDFSYELLGDDAHFMLAEIYNYNLEEKEKAKDLYKTILTRYPGSVFIDESREKYRELRIIYPDKETEPDKKELFLKAPEENEFE